MINQKTVKENRMVAFNAKLYHLKGLNTRALSVEVYDWLFWAEIPN